MLAFWRLRLEQAAACFDFQLLVYMLCQHLGSEIAAYLAPQSAISGQAAVFFLCLMHVIAACLVFQSIISPRLSMAPIERCLRVELTSSSLQAMFRQDV